VLPSVWPLFNAGADRNTFSATLVPLIAAFVVGRRGVTEETARGWVADLDALGEATFFSINRYLFRARVPGGR
jgi:hypothetical protein